MKQDQINKLHELMEKYCAENDVRLPEILSFLNLVFIGTMEKHGYTQEFFDKTCDRMKLDFFRRREKNEVY